MHIKQFRNTKFCFFADFRSFNNFIYDFKKLYTELSGEASIEKSYENDIIKITALNNGKIVIYCEVYLSDGLNSQSCKLGLIIDQTYLIEMVKEIDMIYEDLELM
jgi:hypothetical protein